MGGLMGAVPRIGGFPSTEFETMQHDADISLRPIGGNPFAGFGKGAGFGIKAKKVVVGPPSYSPPPPPPRACEQQQLHHHHHLEQQHA